MAESRAGASRRALLSGGTTLLGSALAGCSTFGTTSGPDSDSTSDPVSMLAAGSLHDALENGLKPDVREPGVDLRVEARGSAAAARLVAEGQKRPDIVSVADPALFDAPLDPAWYAGFATNSMVVAYDPDSPGGQAVADAGPDRW